VNAIPGRQHRPCRDGARKSKNGMGWRDSLKLQIQGDEAGRWYSFDLTTAPVENRQWLDPLTRWLKEMASGRAMVAPSPSPRLKSFPRATWIS